MGRIDFFLGVSLLVLSLPVRTPGFLLSSVWQLSTYNLTGSVFSDGVSRRINGASVVLCDDGGARLGNRY